MAEGVPREGDLDAAHGVGGYLVGVIDVGDTLGGYVEVLVGHYVCNAVAQSAQVFLGLCFVGLCDEGFEQEGFQRFVVIVDEEVLFAHRIARLEVVVLDEEIAVSVGTANELFLTAFVYY